MSTIHSGLNSDWIVHKGQSPIRTFLIKVTNWARSIWQERAGEQNGQVVTNDNISASVRRNESRDLRSRFARLSRPKERAIVEDWS